MARQFCSNNSALMQDRNQRTTEQLSPWYTTVDKGQVTSGHLNAFTDSEWIWDSEWLSQSLLSPDSRQICDLSTCVNSLGQVGAAPKSGQRLEVQTRQNRVSTLPRNLLLSEGSSLFFLPGGWRGETGEARGTSGTHVAVRIRRPSTVSG